jgi:hypothetical protein
MIPAVRTRAKTTTAAGLPTVDMITKRMFRWLTDPSSPARTRTRTIVALATRGVAGSRQVQRGVGRPLLGFAVKPRNTNF